MFNIEAWKKQELEKLPQNLRKQAIEKLSQKIVALKTFKVTAQRLTLIDGTVIITPEEDDWIGKQVTYEDGTTFPPGEYTLAKGRNSNGGIIVIGKDGKVKEVRRESVSNNPVNLGHPQNGFQNFVKQIFQKYYE